MTDMSGNHMFERSLEVHNRTAKAGPQEWPQSMFDALQAQTLASLAMAVELRQLRDEQRLGNLMTAVESSGVRMGLSDAELDAVREEIRGRLNLGE